MDNKSKLFLSTILIGIVGTATGCQQDEWNQLISKGKKEAEIGQYELAKADFTAAMLLVDKPGGDQSRLMESLSILAKQDEQLYQSVEAETLWRRALAIAQAEGNNGKVQAANILWQLSWTLDSQNRKSESLKTSWQ
ncbi:hypothetical protein BH11CYA1_BH11CYA1_23910 [soil metagenome]